MYDTIIVCAFWPDNEVSCDIILCSRFVYAKISSKQGTYGVKLDNIIFTKYSYERTIRNEIFNVPEKKPFVAPIEATDSVLKNLLFSTIALTALSWNLSHPTTQQIITPPTIINNREKDKVN